MSTEGLGDASRIGDASDFLGMFSVAGLLLYFLIPTFVVLLIIYIIRAVARHRKNKHQIADNKSATNNINNDAIVTETVTYNDTAKMKKAIKRIEKVSKDFNTDEKLLKKLKDTKSIYEYDPSRYPNLAVEFDRRGMIIANKR